MLCTHKHALCYSDSPYRYGLYTQAHLMLQGQSIQIWSVHTNTPYVTGTVHTDMVCTHKHALCYRDSPCKYALYTQARLMLQGQSMQICSVHTVTHSVIGSVLGIICSVLTRQTSCDSDSPCKCTLYCSIKFTAILS